MTPPLWFVLSQPASFADSTAGVAFAHRAVQEHASRELGRPVTIRELRRAGVLYVEREGDTVKTSVCAPYGLPS